MAAPSVPISINLGGARVSPVGNSFTLSDGSPFPLTVVGGDGLDIWSGLPFLTGLDATTFYTQAAMQKIDSFEASGAPQSLTTAEFQNLHLVAGETLTINYEYIPEDYQYNDFAFSLLKDPQGNLIPILLGDVNNYVATGNIAFTASYNVRSTGSFDLLLGSANAGDTNEPSLLSIQSLSISVPAGSYTVKNNGLQLGDGTFYGANGGATLPGGASAPNLLSESAANLLTSLGGDVAGNLINQDGNGLTAGAGGQLLTDNGAAVIRNDGGSLLGKNDSALINQDGNGLINQDGNGLIGGDNASLINQDGNGIINQDGNGLISQAGSQLINQDGNGLINAAGGSITDNVYSTLSLDESGGLTRQFSGAQPTPQPSAATPGTEFLISSAAATGASLYDGQTYLYQNNEQIAALSTGKFAASWGITQNLAADSKQIGAGAQLMNADGTPSGAAVAIASGLTATDLDEVGTLSSITALAGGGYAVTFAERTYAIVGNGQTDGLYTLIFDASGNQVGDGHLVGALNSDAQQIASATLSDGSFITVVQTVYGYDGSESAPYVVAQRVGADGANIGSPILIGPSSFSGYGVISVVALQNGAFAVAYLSNPGSSDAGFPRGYVWQMVNADGSMGAPNLLASAGSPAMAVLANGNIVVAWTGSDAAHAQIYTPAGAKAGGEIVGESTLGVGDTGDASPPAITVLADGRFLLAYDIAILNPKFGTALGTDVHAQLYDADGAPSGNVFNGAAPATDVDTDNSSPAAVQLADGTVEIAVTHQAGGFSSDIRGEPVSVMTGGSTAPATPIAPATQGRAVDGYIAGATVFADANGNGVLDAGEASATTDSVGRFTLASGASGPLVMSGGVDASTGLPFATTLTAPAGSFIVSPLTTLVQKLMARKGVSLAIAEQRVNAATALPLSADVAALNPITATLGLMSAGGDASIADTVIQDAVAIAVAAGATGDVYGALADLISADPLHFDPTSVATMQALGLSGTVAADAATIAGASMALVLQNAPGSASQLTSFLAAEAVIAKVAQGATAASVRSGVASGGGLAAVVSAYTGANLTAAVAAASASLPDVSAALTAGAARTLALALATLGSTVLGNVPTITGAGASVPAAAAAGLNALVFAPAAAGGAVTLPTGYHAGYALGAGGTLVDTAGDGLLVGAAPHQTLIGAAGDVLVGGKGGTTFQAGDGAETLAGGSGQNIFFLGGGASQVTSEGADTIVGPSGVGGAATVSAAGAPLFFGEGGATQFNAQGGAATLVGAGAVTVNAGTAAILDFGGTDSTGGLLFNAGSGASTVVSYGGGGTLVGGSASTLFFGIGPTSYAANSAADTVVGYGGGMTVSGGSNNALFFTGAAGGNVIGTGGGSSTIVGFGQGDVYSATGAGADIIEAAGASSTIDGAASSGTNAYFAFANNDVVIGGSGVTAIESAYGDQTLVGGSATTLFELIGGGGARSVSIVNFTSDDFVQLQGFAGGEAATDLQNAAVVNGSEALALSDGTVLTFQGVSGLTASRFV